jgi:nucleoside-diphosphate-sugar epimerase
VKRVLVTGATGFTASYVIPLLKQRGYEVQGLSSTDCDIRDAATVRHAVIAARPDYVVHLAGTSNLPDTERETLFGVNVEGTSNLLEACAAVRPQRILLASSCYVYGDTGPTPAAEDAPLRPGTEYGRSKLEMENVARSWSRRLPVMILRPFNYTGVGHGEGFLVPKLVRAFKERRDDVSFVHAGVVRDFSDVRWVAGVYLTLLERGTSGSVVNICSGTGTPLPTLVGLLEKLSGHRPLHGPPGASARPSRLVGAPGRLGGLLDASSPYALRDTLRWMLHD